MKKLTIILIALIFVLSACHKNDFDAKTVMGEAALFDEEMGYYDQDQSIIQTDDTTRYVFYTTNEVKNVQKDVIGARKLTLQDGKWVAGDKKIVLKPGTVWDTEAVSNPDVVKGEFSLGQTTYSYLMVYQGNAILADKQNQIGFAVANDLLGPWIRVGNKPFVSYDPVVYGSTFGAGQPSVVSYDGKGQVRLFYTYADEFLTSTRLMELDLSDLSNPIGNNSYITVPVNGLQDKDLGNIAMLNNADFATDDANQIYVIRDRNPYPSSAPACADSLQIATADINILYKIGEEALPWNIVIRGFNDSYTSTSDLLGWPRIFSGSFVTDAYGHLLTSTNYEIAYSSSLVATSLEDQTYLFTPSIHVHEVQ